MYQRSKAFGKNGNDVIGGGSKFTVTEIKPDRPGSKVNGFKRSNSKKGIFDKGFGSSHTQKHISNKLDDDFLDKQLANPELENTKKELEIARKIIKEKD